MNDIEVGCSECGSLLVFGDSEIEYKKDSCILNYESEKCVGCGSVFIYSKMLPCNQNQGTGFGVTKVI